MRVKLIIISLVLFSLTLFCPMRFHAEELPVGARSLGMGGAYVAIASNIETLFLNPGGLARLRGTEVFLFYQKPFGLEDLSYGALAVSHPVLNIRTGFGFTSFGNGLYREQRFTLSTGFHFRHKIYYGISIDYETIRITGYGETGQLKLDLGLLIEVSDALQWGFHTTNLNRAANETRGNDVPQSFKSGFALLVDPKLLVALEIFKEIRYDEEFRFGMEFLPFKNLALRAGISNNPDRFSAGIGINVLSFRIDYAFFTHEDLGITHQVSLSLSFGRPHDEGSGPELSKQKTNEPVAVENADPDKIDLNQADREQLMTFPGIGQVLADTILEYRKQHGPFSQLEQLMQIPGIGPKTFEKLRDFIFIGSMVEK